MKKVLIITYYWPPSGGAGVQRWLKFSKYLPEYGWEPVILTVDEKLASYAQLDTTLQNEVSPQLQVVRTKTFEPYNLYKKISAKKEIPYGGFTNEKKISLTERFSRFVRGNLFIPDPRRGWKNYAVKSALQIIDEQNIDLIITTGPPHSVHLIGLALKRRRPVKWIADFRDPWTDIYYYNSLYHSDLAKRIDRSLESKVINRCDHLITVSHALKELLNRKVADRKTDKISVITNGFDTTDFQNVQPVMAHKFTIAYTGTISKSYRIEGFIEALSLLPNEVKEQLLIRFVGNLPDEIIDLFHRHNLSSQLEQIGYVPHQQAINYMAGASLLLMAIPDVPDNKVIITGKFFEYLAAKRPILVIGPKGGDVDLILQQTKAGALLDYDDIRGIQQQLLNHFDSFSKEKLEIYSSEIDPFSRKNLTGNLVSILQKIDSPSV